MEKYRIIAKQLVRRYFKNNSEQPFELTDSQADIFCSIFFKELFINSGYNRIEIIASTQYGKSEVTSMALILRSQFFKEDWSIITGDQKKSNIIMQKMIDHLFDAPSLVEQLEIDSSEKLDRIRRERSKINVNWKQGGGVKAITAVAHNRKRVKEALSGLGSPNIVEDESALIIDDLQAMILRMLGGYAGGYLVKIGNPYENNHFKKTWLSDKYYKIFIDYHIGLAEGRYTHEFIEEMRDEAFFDVLYECQFPNDDDIDLDGFRRLLTDNEIIQAKQVVKHEGDLKIGFDVGEGGDENVGVLRSNTFAQIAHISRVSDLMATTKVIIDLIDKHLGGKDGAGRCSVDGIGIGAGVVARLHELEYYVKNIKWGTKATKDTYANLKAENYWDLGRSIKDGLKLEPHNGWSELTEIKWKEDTSGKVKIKSKEDMRKEGKKSPNIADALALTENRTLEDDAPRVTML